MVELLELLSPCRYMGSAPETGLAPRRQKGNPFSAPRAAPTACCPGQVGRRGQPLRVWQPVPAASSQAGCSASPPRRSVRLPSLPGSCPPGHALGYGIQMLEEDGEFT